MSMKSSQRLALDGAGTMAASVIEHPDVEFGPTLLPVHRRRPNYIIAFAVVLCSVTDSSRFSVWCPGHHNGACRMSHQCRRHAAQQEFLYARVPVRSGCDHAGTDPLGEIEHCLCRLPCQDGWLDFQPARFSEQCARPAEPRNDVRWGATFISHRNSGDDVLRLVHIHEMYRSLPTHQLRRNARGLDTRFGKIGCDNHRLQSVTPRRHSQNGNCLLYTS